MEETLRWSVLVGSAILAGMVNTMAGGGTLLTFPSLQSFGRLSEVFANGTSTVALVWGSLAGGWGYRRELTGTTAPWLRLLILPSLVGGIVGALLVTRLDNSVFKTILPWLLLTASLLFLMQPWLAKWIQRDGEESLPSAKAQAAIVIAQFFIAVYGGYFGAGIGILMLTSLGIMGLSDIHRANAVKTLLAAMINGVSVVVFLMDQKVAWRFVLPMAVGAVVGGYAGAVIGRRLPKWVVRWFVIVVGFGLSVYYFVR